MAACTLGGSALELAALHGDYGPTASGRCPVALGFGLHAAAALQTARGARRTLQSLLTVGSDGDERPFHDNLPPHPSAECPGKYYIQARLQGAGGSVQPSVSRTCLLLAHCRVAQPICLSAWGESRSPRSGLRSTGPVHRSHGWRGRARLPSLRLSGHLAQLSDGLAALHLPPLLRSLGLVRVPGVPPPRVRTNFAINSSPVADGDVVAWRNHAASKGANRPPLPCGSAMQRSNLAVHGDRSPSAHE
mmetsp:Transcript_69124/g.205692  ORF Transcript_69124/g.205692 Transcript_69124/m.205692 type:complete len:247 (-) Transcript_69124:49-789(-)